MHQLKSFLMPESIAIVGASNKKGFAGYAVLNNILKSSFKGQIYPVHPSEPNIIGIKAYRNLTEIPNPVDLAIIAIPAQGVSEVLEQCGQKGIRGVCLFSAGFKETGGNGEILQQKVLQIASKNGIRLIGPNCVGIYNVSDDLNLTASTTLDQIRTMIRPGPIALISQSGGYGIALFVSALHKGMSLSKFFSIGNKCDLDEIDILEYLESDPKTEVVLMFIEEIKDLPRFEATTYRVSKNKPIIAAKMGKSDPGRRAVLSHTGGQIDLNINYDKVFERCGIIKTSTSLEMLDIAKAFVLMPLLKGNRIGIITDSGGLGVEMVDTCQEYGLKIPNISEKTKGKLKEVLPSYCAFNNPVDLTMPSPKHAQLYLNCMQILLASGEVDGVILILSGVGLEYFQPGCKEDLLELKKFGKPIMAFGLGRTEVMEEKRRRLEEGFIPMFDRIRIAAYSMASLNSYAKFIGIKNNQ
jgi:acyl-CoA synthetase (NDP forming)